MGLPDFIQFKAVVVSAGMRVIQHLKLTSEAEIPDAAKQCSETKAHHVRAGFFTALCAYMA